jgi:hypothetical protein
MVDEWKLNWEDAFEIHKELLTNKRLEEDGYADELEPYGFDVDPEGFVPSPQEEALSAAIDELGLKGYKIKKPDWYMGED